MEGRQEAETHPPKGELSPAECRPLFRPRDDYILVRPIERHQSDILRVVTNEKYTQGTVVAVGPGKRSKKGVIHPLTVKPGDFITYGDLNRGYDFYPSYIEKGVVYRILQEADVCFIADPEAPEHRLPPEEISKLVAGSRMLDIA